MLLGGVCWKLALVVTLGSGPAVSSLSSPWFLWLRWLTSVSLDVVAAGLVLGLGRVWPRGATGLGLAGGILGALSVYPAVVLGGPVTSRLLPYASSLRLGLFVPGVVAITVAAVCVVVTLAIAAGRLPRRFVYRGLALLLGSSLTGVVVEAGCGTAAARARLGLDRQHLLVLLPSASLVPGDAVNGSGVGDLETELDAIDPEPAIRSSPIRRQPAPPPRHVLFVILESIATRFVDATTMPHLLELGSDRAVWFHDHVAPSPVSIKALFSLLCGLPPLPTRDLESTALPRIDCRSLPEQLVQEGFEAGFFHGGYFAFTDKLALLTERGFSSLVDGENVAIRDEPVWKNGWGVDDRVVIDESLRWMDERITAGQRTLNVVVPLIPHHEYFLPPDAAKPFGVRTMVDRYKNGLRFADDVLHRLIDGYRGRGLLDDTLIVVVGDHGEAFDEHPGNRLHGSYLYEENLRTPLLIRASSLPAGSQRSMRPSSHIDVAATIMGLLGLSPSPKPGGLDQLAGRDLLADDFVPGLTVHTTSFPTERLAVRGPRLKAIAKNDGQAIELYDRIADPREQQPLPDDLVAERLIAYGRQTAAQHQHILKNAPRLGPTWLERGASSSALTVSSERVFNMTRSCIPLSTSSSQETTLVLETLVPSARFVGVGVIDDSRFRNQGGLRVKVVADDGAVTDVVVTDRFEESSRVVPIAPSRRVIITAAPSPQQARGCVWLSP
jgi:hypothetical protein